MASDENWRAVAEHQAEVKCDQFENDITKILDTFSTGCPLQPDIVYDQHGDPWPVPPSKMALSDVLHFVHRVYGPLFLGFCRRIDALKAVH